MIPVTRNYTWLLSSTKLADGSQPLVQHWYTQSIPLEPALPIHRSRAIIDFSTGYWAGPMDDAAFLPPPDVHCTPSARSAAGAAVTATARLASGRSSNWEIHRESSELASPDVLPG